MTAFTINKKWMFAFVALLSLSWFALAIPAQAATLAEQIICHVDHELGDLPFDPDIDYCGDGGENPPPAACANGTDDDGDGLVDMADPGCANADDNDESNGGGGDTYECSDGIDNDGDGKIDWGVPGNVNADPGCDTPTDDSENSDTPAPQCADGIDNNDPEDTLIDLADPGCTDANDNDETNTGGGGGDDPACSDDQDNDSDGKTDYPADPGCTDANDDNEADDGVGGGGGDNACNDGIDNDGDGLIDFPNDDGCSSIDDDDEVKHSSSGGSRRSGGGGVGGGGEVLGASDCSQYLHSFIRAGRNNDQEQVMRLQYVLKYLENYALDMTGVYDTATLAAVNSFQKKYEADVLAPWAIDDSTGYVYLTTRKKINEVFCDGTKEFPLTPSEQQIIDRSKLGY